MTTLAQALAAAQAQGLTRLAAQQLLLKALGRPLTDRAWLLAHDDHELSAEQCEQLQQGLQRHQAGEPLAYVLGEQDFYGLTLSVDARALVPRPDTETLVDWALACLPLGGRLLDLGTGSGAIALAVCAQRPDAQVVATDASAQALALAKHNARRLGLAPQFHQGYWLQALPADCAPFDVIVSNPPYIAEGDPHLAALLAEPMSALTAGPDGLADLAHLIDHAAPALKPGGWLLLEHGYDQAAAVTQRLRQVGWLAVGSRADLAGVLRCSAGQRPIQTHSLP
ncbi:MAG: peptide chain release factor N(5)-glutamine methyltransferase [Rhodoferax sp.]